MAFQAYRVPFACVMDTKKMKPAEQHTDMKTLRWKMPGFRKSFLKQW